MECVKDKIKENPVKRRNSLTSYKELSKFAKPEDKGPNDVSLMESAFDDGNDYENHHINKEEVRFGLLEWKA